MTPPVFHCHPESPSRASALGVRDPVEPPKEGRQRASRDPFAPQSGDIGMTVKRECWTSAIKEDDRRKGRRRSRQCFLLASAAAVCLFAAAPLNLSGDEPTSEHSAKPGEAGAAEPTQPTAEGGHALDYLYHRRPADGSAARQMMQWTDRGADRAVAADAIGLGRIDDPGALARFERFLAAAELPEEQLRLYNQQYRNVLDLLARGETVEAWKRLLALSEFQEIDAGVSWELAARIESIWNADRTTQRLDRRNRELQREAGNAAWNVDVMSDGVRQRDIEFERRRRSAGGGDRGGRGISDGGAPQLDQAGSTGSGAAPPIDSILGKLQLTEEYLKTLEAKSRIKVNELRAQHLLDTAKSDFAEYIGTLFQSGRYRHVILAADFYRRIFDEGEYPVSMARQVNAALEISRDVQGAVEVFQYLLSEDEVAAATDRLQEAFLLGELHPALLTLPRVQKRHVEQFTRRLSRMRNMIESRDFSGVEELLAEVREIAPDFDATKAMAIVNAVKLESRLRLGRARLAAQQGDLELAMEEFQRAAETWPGNPELETSAELFFDTQDVQTRSLAEFDRMIEEGNYRGVFENQLAFAPAMKDDPERQERLAAALEKVKAAEMAIEKATAQRTHGDLFGAWETVELAIAAYSDDVRLNALRGELAGGAAEFVAAINRAAQAEERGDYGYSLTWYAIAQRHYPPSVIANQGIDRLTDLILTDQVALASSPA